MKREEWHISWGLFPRDLFGVVLLIPAEFEQAEESESAKATSDQDDTKFDNNQIVAPLESLVGEKCQAQIAEDEALREESEELEDDDGALLALR